MGDIRTILPGDINTIRLFSRDHYWITLDEKTYFIPSKIGIIHSRRLTGKKVTSWFPKSSHFKVQSGNKEYVLVEMQYYFFFILTCVQKDKNELLFSNEEKQFLFGVLVNNSLEYKYILDLMDTVSNEDITSHSQNNTSQPPSSQLSQKILNSESLSQYSNNEFISSYNYNISQSPLPSEPSQPLQLKDNHTQKIPNSESLSQYSNNEFISSYNYNISQSPLPSEPSQPLQLKDNHTQKIPNSESLSQYSNNEFISSYNYNISQSTLPLPSEPSEPSQLKDTVCKQKPNTSKPNLIKIPSSVKRSNNTSEQLIGRGSTSFNNIKQGFSSKNKNNMPKFVTSFDYKKFIAPIGDTEYPPTSKTCARQIFLYQFPIIYENMLNYMQCPPERTYYSDMIDFLKSTIGIKIICEVLQNLQKIPSEIMQIVNNSFKCSPITFIEAKDEAMISLRSFKIQCRTFKKYHPNFYDYFIGKKLY